MNTDKVLLKLVARVFCYFRRLYLAGKISREEWLEMTDEFTQFLNKEIE